MCSTHMFSTPPTASATHSAPNLNSKKICPNTPKQHKKLFSDWFGQVSNKNGPIDLVRAYFQAYIGTYIPPNYGPLCNFLGLFGAAQMPRSSINTSFLAVLDHFSYKNGHIDLVRGPFSSSDTGTYISPTCGSVCTFSVHLGAPKCPKTAQKIYIFWLIGPFLFKERA
jgi:hypothetical protein